MLTATAPVKVTQITDTDIMTVRTSGQTAQIIFDQVQVLSFDGFCARERAIVEAKQFAISHGLTLNPFL